MGLTLGHGAWQIDWLSNGSMWNSYSFQPVGQWMGYSFTDLGAEGCCRSMNAVLFFYMSISADVMTLTFDLWPWNSFKIRSLGYIYLVSIIEKWSFVMKLRRFLILTLQWPRDLDLWPLTLKRNSDGAATTIHLWTNFGEEISKGSRVIRDIIKKRTNRQTDETAIGDCELAKILNDNLPVIFIEIYILFLFSISVIFCHFLLFFDLQKLQDSVLW